MQEGFRKMRRFGQQLTQAQCLEVLEKEVRGTLAVNGDDGYPYALPINFTYDAQAGVLYLHSAKAGHKIDAMRQSDKACFCVYDAGRPEPNGRSTLFHSVIVFGRIRLTEGLEANLEYARKFDRKFVLPPEIEEHIRKEGALVQMIEMTVDHMSGKSVVEGYSTALGTQG